MHWNVCSLAVLRLAGVASLLVGQVLSAQQMHVNLAGGLMDFTRDPKTFPAEPKCRGSPSWGGRGGPGACQPPPHSLPCSSDCPLSPSLSAWMTAAWEPPLTEKRGSEYVNAPKCSHWTVTGDHYCCSRKKAPTTHSPGGLKAKLKSHIKCCWDFACCFPLSFHWNIHCQWLQAAEPFAVVPLTLPKYSWQW